MNKLIIFLILIFLSSGCSRARAGQKLTPTKPHESPTVYNFKKSEKDDAKIFQTMGLDYFNQGNWPQAQTNFKKAVKLNPSLYQSWYHLGLLNSGSEDGYNYFKKTVELNPELPTPYFWMAYYHCRLHEDKKAVTLFKKYIELAANEPGEEGRLKLSKEVLQELLSGKDGAILSTIRKPI